MKNLDYPGKRTYEEEMTAVSISHDKKRAESTRISKASHEQHGTSHTRSSPGDESNHDGGSTHVATSARSMGDKNTAPPNTRPLRLRREFLSSDPDIIEGEAMLSRGVRSANGGEQTCQE